MADGLDLLIRLGPLLAGVTVPLVVLYVDAKLRGRKQTVEEHTAEVVRIDGRLDQLITRLENENARTRDELAEVRLELKECKAGREAAFAEIVALRERVLKVERWHGTPERRHQSHDERGG